jgi:hypothetical protein
LSDRGRVNRYVGEISLDSLNDALENLDDALCGGLVKIGEKHFVRHNLQLDDLSVEEFTVPLMVVTNKADELESRYVGGDKY